MNNNLKISFILKIFFFIYIVYIIDINILLKRNVFNFSYRNSFFHNLCTGILQDGYHLAFQELFNLVREAQEVLASDDSINHADQVPLEEDKEKLNFLKEMLVNVEIAKRKGKFLRNDES